MTLANAAAALVHQARAVLLDFDGPICPVFAGYAAHEVATAVSRVAAARGVTLKPADPLDPISAFRATAGLSGEIISAVQDALVYEEREALSRTAPIPGVRAVIAQLHKEGHVIAVVTNNGAEPVTDFLARHDLAAVIDAVIGRDPTRPDQLKPSPVLVERALAAVGVEPNAAVFVGDSISDVEAGRGAGVDVVGFANKPGKYERLRLAGARAIITNMTALTAHHAQGIS